MGPPSIDKSGDLVTPATLFPEWDHFISEDFISSLWEDTRGSYPNVPNFLSYGWGTLTLYISETGELVCCIDPDADESGFVSNPVMILPEHVKGETNEQTFMRHVMADNRRMDMFMYSPKSETSEAWCWKCHVIRIGIPAEGEPPHLEMCGHKFRAYPIAPYCKIHI